MSENKAADVREIQRFLRTISKYNSAIPLVGVSGNYDDETRETVRAFQRENGLPVTGELDSQTWDALYTLYKEAALFFAELESINPRAASSQPMKKGSAGYPVYIIQIMLNTIARFYNNLEGSDINGIYGDGTFEEVKRIQEIAGLPVTGELNRPTWNALARLYNFHAGMDEYVNGKDAVQTMKINAVG